MKKKKKSSGEMNQPCDYEGDGGAGTGCASAAAAEATLRKFPSI